MLKTYKKIPLKNSTSLLTNVQWLLYNHCNFYVCTFVNRVDSQLHYYCKSPENYSLFTCYITAKSQQGLSVMECTGNGCPPEVT